MKGTPTLPTIMNGRFAVVTPPLLDSFDSPFLEVTGANRRVEYIDAVRYLATTAAHPWVPAIERSEESRHMTSSTAMELHEVPKSQLVLGGG